MTPTISPPNSGLDVGSVPAVVGTLGLAAGEPPIASAGMIRKKRPTSMARPRVTVYQSGPVDWPANADPLLLAAEAKLYSSSDRPWGPGWNVCADTSTAEAAAKTSSTVGIARMYSVSSFISGAWIFLPRYSGVRPTINPAMNTASRANTSMPINPTPTPPGETSPNIMCTIGTVPPSGVNESCMQSTAPAEVPVVAAANSPQAAAPKRTSLPSMLPPDCVVEIDWSTPSAFSAGLPFCSANIVNPLISTRIPAITASNSRDWRLSFTR